MGVLSAGYWWIARLSLQACIPMSSCNGILPEPLGASEPSLVVCTLTHISPRCTSHPALVLPQHSGCMGGEMVTTETAEVPTKFLVKPLHLGY